MKVTSPYLRGEPDYVDPPSAKSEDAADVLVRHGWGCEYLDCGRWRIFGPNDPVFDGAFVSSGLMREMAFTVEQGAKVR